MELLHPKIVHLPIALAVLMPLIASGLLFAWWRGFFERRIWILAVVFQGLLVASGVVALRTGEIDEERVEEVVAESHIEAHEEAAEVFVWVSGVVFAIALAAVFVPKRPAALGVAALAVIGTLVVFFLGYRTGDAGGDLVYEHGAASAYVDGTTGGGAAARDEARRGSHEEDEDD